MITRRLRAWLGALALLLCAEAAGAAEVFSFVYLSREGDPDYERQRAYTGLVLRDRFPPLAGAQLALRESRIMGRALDLKFELIERVLAPGEDAKAALAALRGAEGARVFILDLPLEDLRALAADLGGEDLVLFNVRHRDDDLRNENCAPALFHTLPSQAMLMDGLGQFLLKKNWTDVLLLEGPAEADRALSGAFQGAARKFGLEIADVRPFVLTNDPRLRDQSNLALLTGGVSYDAIFLADSAGEFGRYVPYQSFLPRPVLGTEGLVASGWHWTWERYGAPQLNQRFDKRAERRMTETDWAGWLAVRAIVEAIAGTKSTAIAELRDQLRSEDFTLDLYKGVPGSFRPWNNQLRQAVLLHSHNAVAAVAPVEGFLHHRNNLDTLGVDKPQSRCKLE